VKRLAKRKKRYRTRHPCDKGWRVRWTAKFRRQAKSLGIWKSVRFELKDLERKLSSPESMSKTLQSLLAKPVVLDVYVKSLRKWFPARRYYFGKKTARGFFVVQMDICRVWFVSIKPRTSKTYKKKSERI